jgi:hypothetical protein
VFHKRASMSCSTCIAYLVQQVTNTTTNLLIAATRKFVNHTSYCINYHETKMASTELVYKLTCIENELGAAQPTEWLGYHPGFESRRGKTSNCSPKRLHRLRGPPNLPLNVSMGSSPGLKRSNVRLITYLHQHWGYKCFLHTPSRGVIWTSPFLYLKRKGLS